MTYTFCKGYYGFLCNCNNVISNASINGHLDCLIYFVEESLGGKYEIFKSDFNAIKNGHLNCIKYIYVMFGLSNSSQILCDYAEENGNIEYLIYAINNGYLQNNLFLKTKDTHKCCIEYANKHNIEWNEYMFYSAVSSGCKINNYAMYKIFILQHIYINIINVLII